TPNNTVGTLENGLVNVPLTAAAGVASANTSLTLLGEPRNAKTAYAQAYSLQVQYQLTPSTVVSVGYIGTNSRHVQTGSINTNTVASVLSPSANLKSNAFFPSFATGGTFIARAGQSNYNSLQVNA